MYFSKILAAIIGLFLLYSNSVLSEGDDVFTFYDAKGQLQVTPKHLTVGDDSQLLLGFAVKYNLTSANQTFPSLQPLWPDLKYKLYTRDVDGMQFKRNTIPRTPFILNTKTVMIIPGYLEYDTGFLNWITELKDIYLQGNNYNIITVNWFYFLSPRANYFWSAMMSKTIGNHIGSMLVDLINLSKISPENTHVIGFSLGAHIAGFAGKQVEKKMDKKLGRITGLDPAALMFETSPFHDLVNAQNRLSADDATFVDVIHSSAGLIGIGRSVGQVDFYPNCGCGIQPSCTKAIWNVMNQEACSHFKSHYLFMQTVNNSSEPLYGYKCSSWIKFTSGQCDSNLRNELGENAQPSPTGDFYLYTN